MLFSDLAAGPSLLAPVGDSRAGPAGRKARPATASLGEVQMSTAFSSVLALFGGYVEWWQLALLPVLIGLIVFYFWNKKRQM